MSIDTPEQGAGSPGSSASPSPRLSDPGMQMIRAYGMKGEGMEMADLGYVVIDKQGRIRTRQIDRRFGNVDMIVRALREARGQS